MVLDRLREDLAYHQGNWAGEQAWHVGANLSVVLWLRLMRVCHGSVFCPVPGRLLSQSCRNFRLAGRLGMDDFRMKSSYPIIKKDNFYVCSKNK